MKTLKERSRKDEAMFQSEMKILQRMVAHDSKMKDFMNTKENERLGFKAEEAEKRAKMSLYLCIFGKFKVFTISQMLFFLITAQ